MANESELTPVPVDMLHPGLYVEALDRPWVETPFLFQGFRIASEAELESLRRYCRQAYVRLDLAARERLKRNGLNSAANGAAHSSTPANGDGGASSVRRTRRERGVLFGADPHPDRQTFSRLVGAARDAREQARVAANEVFRAAYQGVPIDTARAGEAVATLRQVLADDPTAALWLMHLRSHEAYSAQHAVNCCVLALDFGLYFRMGEQALHNLGLGALLMDIGKVRLPRDLLTKKGAYTAAEFDRMCRHVAHSCELLQNDDHLPMEVLEIVRLHHERKGGQGYPRGVGGDQIPRQALIAGLVDSFDAMISSRPYRVARRPEEALQSLYGNAAVTFGTDLVEAFIHCLGSFPVGSLVELDHGEIAVVVGNRPGSGVWPTVLMLRQADGSAYRRRMLVNLASGDQPGMQVSSRQVRRALAPHEANIDLQKVVAFEFGQNRSPH